jgi:hypothetical protein
MSALGLTLNKLVMDFVEGYRFMKGDMDPSIRVIVRDQYHQF